MTTAPEAEVDAGNGTNSVPSTPPAKMVTKPILSGGKKVAELYVTGLEVRLHSNLSTNRAAVVAKMAESGSSRVLLICAVTSRAIFKATGTMKS